MIINGDNMGTEMCHKLVYANLPLTTSTCLSAAIHGADVTSTEYG